MSFLNKLRSDYPELSNVPDDVLIQNLDKFEPQIFADLPYEERKKLATQDNLYLSDLARSGWAGVKRVGGNIARGVEQEFGLSNNFSGRIYDSAEATESKIDPLDRLKTQRVGFQEESQNTLGGLGHAAIGSAGSMAVMAPAALAGPFSPAVTAVLGRYMLGGGSAKETEDRLKQISDDDILASPLFQSYLVRAERYKDQVPDTFRLARDQFEKDLIEQNFQDMGAVGATSMGLLGPAMGSVIRGGSGALSGAAKGFGVESAQEFLESGTESYAGARAEALATGGEIDTDRVLRDALFGAALGGAIGGGVGGLTGALRSDPKAIVRSAEEEVAANGGDELDVQVAGATVEQELARQDYSQFDTPALNREAESARSLDGIDGLIIIAERIGAVDEVAQLVTAKRLYRQADEARASGNNDMASYYARKGNELYQKATETNETIRQESRNFPVPYVFGGQVEGGQLSTLSPSQDTSTIIDQQPEPSRLTGTRGLLNDSGIIYGQEPADITAARQQREADDFNARYGQEGTTPYRNDALVGELDRSNELPSPDNQLSLPQGTGQIDLGRDAPSRTFTPTPNQFDGVGRNVVERQASTQPALPQANPARSITQAQMIDAQNVYRQAIRTSVRNRTPEQVQAVEIINAVRSGEITVVDQMQATNPVVANEAAISAPQAVENNKAPLLFKKDGTPFASEKGAKASKAWNEITRSGVTPEVVPVNGGFGVRSISETPQNQTPIGGMDVDIVHMDANGTNVESVTQKVIKDAKDDAVQNTNFKSHSEVKKYLNTEIDSAIANADYDTNADTFVEFSVPGDGVFRVRNSIAELQEFKKKVNGSDAKLRSRAPLNTVITDELRSTEAQGSGGSMSAIKNFLSDGEVDNAINLAESAGVTYTLAKDGDSTYPVFGTMETFGGVELLVGQYQREREGLKYAAIDPISGTTIVGNAKNESEVRSKLNSAEKSKKGNIERVVTEARNRSEKSKPAPDKSPTKENGEAKLSRKGNVDSKAFKDWFGDSKVVDANGDPLVVYHGTNADFTAFSELKLGESTGAPSAKMGFFFASSPDVASSYTEYGNAYEDNRFIGALNRWTNGWYERINEALLSKINKSGVVSGGNVMPVYLSIKDPLIVDQKGVNYREETYFNILNKAKKEGRDGVIIRNTFDEGFSEGGDKLTDIYVAFEPTQIKSATGNQGAFDPTNPDIRFRRSDVDSTSTTEGVTNDPSESVNRLNEALSRSGERADTRSAVRESLTGGKRQAADFTEAIAQQFGVEINWVTSSVFDGVHHAGDIFVNVDSSAPYHVVLGHELVHTLKNTDADLYAQLEALIMPEATMTKESAKFHRYGERTMNANEEYVADVVGNRFGEKQFWRDMAAAEPNLFRRIATVVRSLLEKVVAQFRGDRTKYGDAVRDLNKVRAGISEVMIEYRKRQASMSKQEFASKYEPQFSPSGVDQTQSQAFKSWFGDSKVVDSNGDPLVVYHGTNSEFNVFDLGKIGEGGSSRVLGKKSESAIYFTGNQSHAEMYGDNIVDAYVSIKNPLVIDAEANLQSWAMEGEETGTPLSAQELIDQVYDGNAYTAMNTDTELEQAVKQARKNGNDGVIYKTGSLRDADAGVLGGIYIAFEPTQIKSATGNQGTFDPNNPDIRFSLIGNAVRGAMDSVTGRNNDPQNTPGGLEIPTEKMTDVIVRKLQDKYKVLKDVQENIKKQGKTIDEDADAYLAEELFHGKTTEDLNTITKNMVEPFAKLLAKHKIDQADLDLYLMAKHAEERNAHIASINPDMPDGGSGLTNTQARKILSDVAASGKQAQYDEIAQIVYDMTANRRSILIEGGLIDETEVDAWQNKYEFYVPLKGWAADENQSGRPKTGKGLSIGGKETKRALGRSSQAASPSSYAIVDLTESIVRKRKNEVGNAFLKLVEQNPDKDFWQVFTDENPETTRTIKKRKDANGNTVEEVTEQVVPMAMFRDHYFTTKVDGKTHYIKFGDNETGQLLLKAMNNVGPETHNAFTRVMGSLTRMMSALNTSYNPEFVIGNFARDVQTAILNLTAEETRAGGKVEGERIAKQTVKDIPKAMRAVYRGLRGKKATNPEWQQWYDEFRQAGAQTGYFDMKDIDGQIKDVEQLVQIAQGGFVGGFHKWRKAGAKVVEDMNSAVENAVRLSAYVNARKAGVSQAKAASLAKNLTVNFNRRGEMGTLMNSLYMFFNASVQGIAQFGRTMFGLKGNDQDPAWKRLTTAQKIAAGIAVGAYALAQANRMAAGEDDDGENWYDKVPDYVRERNLVFMKSLFGGPQDGSYWKIPLPYGYNIFAIFGENAQAVTSGNRSVSKTAAELSMGVMGSFNPIGFVDSQSLSAGIMRNITPTIGKPIADLVANENFMGTSIYNENFPFGTPKPDSQLARRSTPVFYKNVAEWLNEVSGGSQWRSGHIDINPDAMRYMVNFFTGGAGAFFTSKVPDNAIRLSTGVEIEPHKTVFLSRLNGRVLPYEDQSIFYKRRDEIGQLNEEMKALSGNDRLEFMRSNRDMLALRPLIRTTENELKALRSRRDAIQSNVELSAREKDQRLKEIEALMKRSVDRFNRRYNEISAS